MTSFDALPWLARIFLPAWVLVMISVPILKWRWGSGAERAGIVLGVLLQAATVLAILVAAWGVVSTLRAACIVIGLGWGVEYAGSHTGWPFGRYHYTSRLQPQVGGVPLLIPLAWLMMLPPAWAVAQAIAGPLGLGFIAVAALAFTAWDLFLDPQMVAWGFWTWDQPGGYFGIPWLNFGGWLLASAVMTAAVAPAPLPSAPLCLVYGITWGLQAFGQFFFWKLRGPALAGFVAMGVWLVWALVA
ncbi:MAG: carotenoid biosynthesis protein [Anaerolineae bacterium]|nr:carotenoid biosynthesis protein [Anaerolineae bacterium]